MLKITDKAVNELIVCIILLSGPCELKSVRETQPHLLSVETKRNSRKFIVKKGLSEVSRPVTSVMPRNRDVFVVGDRHLMSFPKDISQEKPLLSKELLQSKSPPFSTSKTTRDAYYCFASNDPDEIATKTTETPQLALHAHTRRLVFRDDFNGPTLDASKWNVINESHLLSDDLQHYTPNDVYVEDGNLVLQTQRRLYAGRNYTSGLADTFGKVAFLYGTVEFRAKLPPTKTANAAFSFMLTLYSAACHAGIHCAEPYSIGFLSVEGENSASVTYGPNRNVDSVDKPFLVYSEREYSVYKVHWTADQIVWYVDGEEIERVTDVGKVPHVPMKLGLKMRVFQVDEEGLVRAADERVGAEEFPAMMRIDYVEVNDFSLLIKS
ncbi:hypothetical protein BV898_02137 [Hypsibius exemplaris]|uniref:GH16 domain-containing protein n=1 Tax=Hypsibius exemplaris TaxID=2072580 RepID=A0A1W0X9V8_HYPEX|nr:hypothetical protein BV898_02137 [Hypsibius exemplaris]